MGTPLLAERENHWLADVVVARGVRSRMMALSFLQTSFLEWMAYQRGK